MVAAFFSTFLDLKQPNLSVEITEIEQNNSAPIDIGTLPEFVSLRKFVVGRFFGGSTPDQLQQFLNREKQGLEDQKQDLQKQKDTFANRPRNAPKDENKKAGAGVSQFHNPRVSPSMIRSTRPNFRMTKPRK